MQKRILVSFLAVVLVFCLGACTKKQRQMRVYLQPGGEVSAKADVEGIEVTGLVYMQLGNDGNLETVIARPDGTVVTTGTVAYASSSTSVELVQLDARTVAFFIKDCNARYVKITATYTDEGIEPIVKEMDFTITHYGKLLDENWSFDLDNHMQVPADSPQADIIVTKHTYETFDVTLNFPHGYKAVVHDPNVSYIGFPFAQYEQYPDDSELTLTELATEDIALIWLENFFVCKSTEGKYYKVFFYGASSDKAIELEFSYLELLPPQD